MRTILNELLTTSDVCHMFNRSEMTIWLWRKNLNMPYIVIPGTERQTIRYDKDEVTTWAKKQGKEITKLPKVA